MSSMCSGGDAMVDIILAVVVVDSMLLALAVDLTARAGWLRLRCGRWHRGAHLSDS
jgi:hypothetical protein